MGYPDPYGRKVLLYRWIVFLLAASYCVYQILWSADYSVPGGPFRFLTIWALLASFFCASRMLAFSEDRSSREWRVAAAITAVLNGLVVVLYWKLWFEDPAQVNSDGPIVWHQEYYLHLLGPVLQWIDALFILGAFRALRLAFAGLAALIAAYVGWIEGIVRALADFPHGTVTDGLPYPFLNNLAWPERLEFYATTAIGGAVILLLFTGLDIAVRRRRQRAFSAISASRPSR